MNIEDFVNYVNNNAEKYPIYGKEEYTDIDSTYYKKLSVTNNGFITCPKNRLSYEVVWNKKCFKRNIFILFNPSIANSDILDETLKNCVRICCALENSNKKDKCGGMIIYNTFTVRHPQIKDAIKLIDYQYEKNNNPIFQLAEHYSNNISKLIVAWGNDAKIKLDKDYYNCLIKLISEIKEKQHKVYAYKINTSGAKQPSHPSPRCTKWVKQFCENPRLTEINFN